VQDHDCKTSACGDQLNDPEHSGCECRLAFKLMFAKCCRENCPCPSARGGGGSVLRKTQGAHEG